MVCENEKQTNKFCFIVFSRHNFIYIYTICPLRTWQKKIPPHTISLLVPFTNFALKNSRYFKMNNFNTTFFFVFVSALKKKEILNLKDTKKNCLLFRIVIYNFSLSIFLCILSHVSGTLTETKKYNVNMICSNNNQTQFDIYSNKYFWIFSRFVYVLFHTN